MKLWTPEMVGGSSGEDEAIGRAEELLAALHSDLASPWHLPKQCRGGDISPRDNFWTRSKHRRTETRYMASG